MAASLGAALVLLVGHVGVPLAATHVESPLLQAMTLHAYLLNWAAGLMASVGWIDSAFAYLRGGGERAQGR